MALARIVARYVPAQPTIAHFVTKNNDLLQPRYDRTRPLAFMHIPKTSGTAILSGLMALAPVAGTSRYYDFSLFGSYDDFTSIDPDIRRQIC